MEEWVIFKSLKTVDILVSSYGNVKSINKNGVERYISLYKRGGKRNQYLCFGYRYNGKKILINIHSAVALSFLGEKPSDKHQVDHIDNNPENNNVVNLRWLTDVENGKKGNSI